MRYMFAKLINPVSHDPMFMLPENFKAYSHIPIFRNTVSSVVVVDNIYIGGFPLMCNWFDITRYNDDAKIIYESDFICFNTHELNELNSELPIENYI